MAKTKKITIDDLAVMVKHGFDEMDNRFKEVDERFNKLEEKIGGMEIDIGELRQGQERIEMRLQNVVYRIELDAVLERVEILENQVKSLLKKN